MFNKKDKKNKNKNEEENPVEEQLDFGFDETDDFDDFDEPFDAFDDFEDDDETEANSNEAEDVSAKVPDEPAQDDEEELEYTDDYEEPEEDLEEQEPEETEEILSDDEYDDDYVEDDQDDDEYNDDYDEDEEYEELPEEDEYEEVDEVEELPEEDEYEEVDDEEYEELPEEDEYEEVDEVEELPEEDEYEEVDEVEELPEEDEYEEVDDEEYEELPEEDEYEEVDEVEELPEEDEYEEVDDEEYEELPEEDEYEEVDEVEELPEEDEFEEVDEVEELPEEDEYEEVDEVEELPEEDEFEEVEETEEPSEDEQLAIEEEVEESEAEEDEEEIEEPETEEDEAEESDEIETEDEDELETEEYTKEAENLEDVLNSDEEEDEEADDTADMYPEELIDIELECIYIGLLFNNPKAISRYYLLYDDCRFSNKELGNLYRIIIFRDGEQYAPAQAKDRYQLPRENPKTYDLRWKVRKLASAKNYNLENVYIELKKLFILKKNYVSAPTAAIRQKILEIQDYELYADMSVEEVESALEQITVTTGLSQAVLNKGATEFLLRGDTELSTGISLPFKIISTVFKGLRKGETMCYAMPSNSGKSRFAINMACYIAFIHKQKVLIISNEMSQEKMRLCMITTILNNPEIQKLHGQKVSKTEGELLELKFRADNPKRIKCDENGFILRKEGETQEEFIEKLKKYSKEFKAVTAATEWLDTQLNNSIYFIHITEHSNDDLRKIILNYYYKEGIEYMFYDTLKADTDHIGNGDEIKKTATILSNIAQKFKVFICSSMQLLESNTLPVNLNINDMSASKTVKEVLDTLCLMKQISRQTLKKYEYSDSELFEKTHKIKVPKDPDIRHYACVVDKNRAGAKPTVLFELNLAYNSWEELGHLRLIQTEMDEE